MVLVRGDLSAVPALLEIARRSVRLVRQNLVFAALAITVLVALDLTGQLSLPVGVALRWVSAEPRTRREAGPTRSAGR